MPNQLSSRSARFSNQLNKRKKKRDAFREQTRQIRTQLLKASHDLQALCGEPLSLRRRPEHVALLNVFDMGWSELNDEEKAPFFTPITLFELRAHIVAVLFAFLKVDVISEQGFKHAVDEINKQVNGHLSHFVAKHGDKVDLTITPISTKTKANQSQAMNSLMPSSTLH